MRRQFLQRAAKAFSPCCVGFRSTLRCPSQHAAFSPSFTGCYKNCLIELSAHSGKVLFTKAFNGLSVYSVQFFSLQETGNICCRDIYETAAGCL